MKLQDKLGQHVTAHTVEGPMTGILLDVSNGAGPQYIVLQTSVGEDEVREDIIPWHQIKRIHPYSQVDEEVITQLEHLKMAEP